MKQIAVFAHYDKDNIVDDVSITKTLTILRGYTVRLACGGYGGGNSTSDEATRAIDLSGWALIATAGFSMTTKG